MQWLLILLSFAVDAWPRDDTVSGVADRETTYVLARINGGPAPATATIRFPEEGRISGDGPCNGYAAQQTATYPAIRIGAVASTRMACPEHGFERLYFKSLQAATNVAVTGDVVTLSDPGGLEMVFVAQE